LALLCTIGYEGYATAEWLAALRAQGVETIIDVRDLPLSRKRGFSKSQLRESLEAVGIEYLHVRALGNPRQYREALHQEWSSALSRASSLSCLTASDKHLTRFWSTPSKSEFVCSAMRRTLPAVTAVLSPKSCAEWDQDSSRLCTFAMTSQCRPKVPLTVAVCRDYTAGISDPCSVVPGRQ
jgi:hypothetical protein